MTSAALYRRLAALESRSAAGEGELILVTDPDAGIEETVAATERGDPRPTIVRVNDGPRVSRCGTTLTVILDHIARHGRRIHDREAA